MADAPAKAFTFANNGAGALQRVNRKRVFSFIVGTVFDILHTCSPTTTPAYAPAKASTFANNGAGAFPKKY